MNWVEWDPLSGMIAVVTAMLMLALILAFLRLVRGPSLPDRVVALDLIAALIVGIISVRSVATGQALFLQVAIVVALILFLGTIAFARYLEKRTLK